MVLRLLSYQGYQRCNQYYDSLRLDTIKKNDLKPWSHSKYVKIYRFGLSIGSLSGKRESFIYKIIWIQISQRDSFSSKREDFMHKRVWIEMAISQVGPLTLTVKGL